MGAQICTLMCTYVLKGSREIVARYIGSLRVRTSPKIASIGSVLDNWAPQIRTLNAVTVTPPKFDIYASYEWPEIPMKDRKRKAEYRHLQHDPTSTHLLTQAGIWGISGWTMVLFLGKKYKLIRSDFHWQRSVASWIWVTLGGTAASAEQDCLEGRHASLDGGLELGVRVAKA